MSLAIVALTLAACTAPLTEESEDRFWSHRFSVNPGVPYGDDPAQNLDLYLQGSWIGEPKYFERVPDERPTLIFIHGGGWVGGTKASNEPLLIPFLERGWHVVNIEYRLGPGTAPAAVDDVVCALHWVVENAPEHGFDRERIVVGGASAGGHLALMTGILGSRPGHACYPGDDFSVAAVVNWFGITDIAAVEHYLSEEQPEINYARAWVGDPDRVAEISASYSPLEIVDGDIPPVLTIHGDADTVVPHDQATLFHDRLSELGTIHELHTIPGGKHMGFTDDQFQEAFAAVFSFLERVGVQG